MSEAEQVIEFWFVEHNRDDWFGISNQFDQKLREKFYDFVGFYARIEPLPGTVIYAGQWRRLAILLRSALWV